MYANASFILLCCIFFFKPPYTVLPDSLGGANFGPEQYVLLIGHTKHISCAGRFWNRWSLCPDDASACEQSMWAFFLRKIFLLLISWVEMNYFFLNATSMIETQCWHLNWVWSKTNNQQNSFARRWQQVTQVRMGDSQCHAVQLRRYFHR
jgi:hypothetical protein